MDLKELKKHVKQVGFINGYLEKDLDLLQRLDTYREEVPSLSYPGYDGENFGHHRPPVQITLTNEEPDAFNELTRDILRVRILKQLNEIKASVERALVAGFGEAPNSKTP